MGVAGDDHVHLVIQTLDDIDYWAGNRVGLGVGPAVIAALLAALVQGDDDGAHAMPAQLGHGLVDGVRLVDEAQAGHAARRDDRRGFLQYRTDHANTHAIAEVDGVGWQQGFTGALVDHVARHHGKACALPRVVEERPVAVVATGEQAQ